MTEPTGNPFIDLPPPPGFAKIRHPRESRIFIERQMQSNPHRWAFVAHTGISYYVPGKFDTQEAAIAACDEVLVPQYAREVYLRIKRIIKEEGQIGEFDTRAYAKMRWPDLSDDLHTKIIECAVAATLE